MLEGGPGARNVLARFEHGGHTSWIYICLDSIPSCPVAGLNPAFVATRKSEICLLERVVLVTVIRKSDPDPGMFAQLAVSCCATVSHSSLDHPPLIKLWTSVALAESRLRYNGRRS